MEKHISPQNDGDLPINDTLKVTLILYLWYKVSKLIVVGLLILCIVALAQFGSQKFGAPNYIPLTVISVLVVAFNAFALYHVFRAFKGNMNSVRILIACAVIDAIVALVVSVFLVAEFGVIPFFAGLLFLASSVALAVFLDKGIAR
ncbi:MAG: hypothetical protein IKP27_08105 [Paludibacteraceae bacterium]|nr:hypothetical protein [Paludibacteraceae bacterium]